jgi:hypothetical protein
VAIGRHLAKTEAKSYQLENALPVHSPKFLRHIRYWICWIELDGKPRSPEVDQIWNAPGHPDADAMKLTNAYSPGS